MCEHHYYQFDFLTNFDNVHKIVYFVQFQWGDRLYTSEYDGSRRRFWRINILIILVRAAPARTKIIKIFIMTVDPSQRYSDEADIGNLKTIWFQIEKNPFASIVYTNIIQSCKC